MTRRQFKVVVLVPVLAWAALCAALLLTAVYAHWHGAPVKTFMSLAIAALKLVIIAVVFMRLDRAGALVRLTSITGLLWLSFLFVLAFADYLTRAYPP